MSDIKEDSDSEDDRSSIEMPVNFAVVTLQDTDEVMVASSEWLNTDKTQCQWPPFRSTEKLMQAVRNRIEPSAAWELLNIHFHEEYETYEEAINKQEELVQAQKYGMFAAITLQESEELTVVPTSWLNEEKTQCYWPPFKSPEKFLEAVQKRHEPERGEKPWEMLNIVFHKAYLVRPVTLSTPIHSQRCRKRRVARVLRALVLFQSSRGFYVCHSIGEGVVYSVADSDPLPPSGWGGASVLDPEWRPWTLGSAETVCVERRAPPPPHRPA
ncbi:uncharacterized protein [Misgurnus anguillicaudatus]|uniref:uncharacterized protein n=1 Tax=Misgurnus anguillicaudatus TaxID=75329 RepID=UPI003CCF237C